MIVSAMSIQIVLWFITSHLIAFGGTSVPLSYHIAFLGASDGIQGPNVGSVYTYDVDTTTSPPEFIGAVDNCTLEGYVGPVSSTILYDISTKNCSDILPHGVDLVRGGMRVLVSDLGAATLHVMQTDVSYSEGYLAIPDEHLGTEYYVLTYCSLGGFCQFAVTPVENDTVVNVYFPGNVTVNMTCWHDVGVSLMEVTSGNVVPFTLNELDVLHFESPADLSGTRIVSDKKVGVIVGARDVPTKFPDETSRLIEQIPPVNKWGKEFVLAANPLNDAGDVIKIITKGNNTRITMTGFSPFVIPLAGASIERRVDWGMPTHIEASSPVFVLQIMSVDLYNSTDDVYGVPSMVQVPAIQQWTTDRMRFQCETSNTNNYDTLVLVAMQNDTNIYAQNLTRSYVNGSYFEVGAITFDWSNQDKPVLGTGEMSAVGYCNGTSAFLLAANWLADSVECTPTTASAADGIDNDCDGEIDEAVCTDEDRVTSFIITDGETISMVIDGASLIPITLTLCENVNVMLQLLTDTDVFTVINILNGSISTETCEPGCNGLDKTMTDFQYGDCEQQTLVLNVTQGATPGTSTGTMHSLEANNTAVSWTSTHTMVYTEMRALSVYGDTNMTVELMSTDCGKIIHNGTADNFGTRFIVPVFDSDDNFVIFMTSKTRDVITVTFSVTTATCEISPNSTVVRWQGFFILSDSTRFDGIILEATDEITVSVIRWVHGTDVYGTKLIPTDVLGPVYYVPSKDAEQCDVFAMELGVDWLSDIEDGLAPFGHNWYNVHSYGHVRAYQPMAAFCGGNNSIVQMAPQDSLGNQFYIPALPLNAISADAFIDVVSTEDSTVITVKGDYDQLDVLHLTGEGHTRQMTNDTIYEVTSTKPVQVHVTLMGQASGGASSWQSLSAIPSVDQYTHDHLFPGLSELDYVSSHGVDAFGMNAPMVPVSTNYSALTYSVPTFTLTLLTVNNTFFVYPSDTAYSNINQVCQISSGSVAGDSVDNDCDGLVDEELCTNTIVAGAVDVDIDGSVNEDCSSGNGALPIDLQMVIPLFNNDTCELNTTTTSTTTTSTHAPTASTGQETPKITTDKAPTFSTITASAPMVTITGSNEGCTTGCSCPCGWVSDPKNYTDEELHELVEAIQEKLRLSKDELSAWIRTKTSAPDSRVSASAVGYVSLVFLAVTIGIIFLLDLSLIRSHIKLFLENISCRK